MIQSVECNPSLYDPLCRRDDLTLLVNEKNGAQIDDLTLLVDEKEMGLKVLVRIDDLTPREKNGAQIDDITLLVG
jgi:hypothetical protein